MKRIAIIGMGHVGASLAYNLVLNKICTELVLIDQNQAKAQAESYDLQDASQANQDNLTTFVNDYGALGKSDLLVVSLGRITLLSEGITDRLAEFKETHLMIDAIAPKIKDSGFKGLILVITNPNDAVTQYLQEALDYPRQKIFGSGCVIDSHRLKLALAQNFKVEPSAISALVIGEHGESQFAPVSQIRLNGEKLKSEQAKEMPAIEQLARRRGWEILSRKGYTAYGIATTVGSIIQGMANHQSQVLPISNYDAVTDCYYAYPAVLSPIGVGERLELDLTRDELNRLQNSIATIRAALEAVSKA